MPQWKLPYGYSNIGVNMQYVLTNAQMRAADEYTIQTKNVPSLTLMERAAEKLFAVAKTMLRAGEKALCVCGGGNNGGDGFALARKLNAYGLETHAVFFAERATSENDTQRKSFLLSGGVLLKEVPKSGYALVVDCLLGTGFKGELREEYASAITAINALKAQGAKVLSADIPSGVNGDNGMVAEVAVRADTTLCLGEYKRGVFLNDGIDYAGIALRADIGINLPKTKYVYWIDKKSVRDVLPVRKRNSHKGTYKKAAIVAGSEQYSGAAYLSTAACLRSGVGYTTLFTPKTVLLQSIWKAPEALLKSLNDGGRVAFNEETFREILSYECVAYGMGLGVTQDVARGAEFLLKEYTGRLVLDADALNALSALGVNTDALFVNKKCDVAITPHVKEFSRLTGQSVEEILQSPIESAETLARRWKVTVLLKNAVSVITNGKETALCSAGNAGQAKGGSGDVLSGLAAGLCAWGKDVFSAVKTAAYLSGKAAEIAAKTVGEYALTATDCISALGAAFLSVSENADE